MAGNAGRMAPPAETDLLAGRYRRLSSIGSGGMARVHLAEDQRLGRRVAVKQLHATGPEDAALRFEREAKLGASLNHPNLVSIYDIAADEESVLIVMEYVDGRTLQQAIARGPLPPGRVAEVVRDVAAALDHAHAHGVVHRDVKPANILLRRDGVAKLADLGIATAAERTSITRSDVVLGTAAYMAPEQLAGERAGPAADVYALAAVAYEALSGCKARTGKTPVEVAHEVVSGAPPDLRAEWPAAPPEAAVVLARGMAREPERRPRSAGALAAGLGRALSGASAPQATGPTALLGQGAVGERPRPDPRRAGPAGGQAVRQAARPVGGQASPPSKEAARKWRWLPALAALALVAVGAAIGIAALGGDNGGEPARQADRGGQAAGGDGGSGSAGGSEGASPLATGAPGRDAPPGAARPERDLGTGAVPEAAGQPTTNPVALNDEGYRLMQAGDYEAAIPVLEQAVAAFPEGSQELTYAYALYNLGRSLRLAGRAAEAVPILERRLAIPNQTGTVRSELAAARAEL